MKHHKQGFGNSSQLFCEERDKFAKAATEEAKNSLKTGTNTETSSMTEVVQATVTEETSSPAEPSCDVPTQDNNEEEDLYVGETPEDKSQTRLKHATPNSSDSVVSATQSSEEDVGAGCNTEMVSNTDKGVLHTQIHIHTNTMNEHTQHVHTHVPNK